MHEGNPVLNLQIGGNGTSTARLYVFVECALFLQSLFQQNKRTSRLGRLLALSLEILIALGPGDHMFYTLLGLYRENVKKSSCLKPEGLDY